MPRRFRSSPPRRYTPTLAPLKSVAWSSADDLMDVEWDGAGEPPIVGPTVTAACWALALVVLVVIFIYIASCDRPWMLSGVPPPCRHPVFEMDELLCPSVMPRRMLEK